MESIARKNRLYNIAFVRLIRFFLFLGLTGLIFLYINNYAIVKFPLFFLSLLIINEVFFHFSLSRHMPAKTVQTTDAKHPQEALTLAATEVFLSGHTQGILRDLFTKTQVQFFLHKAELFPKDIPVIQISRDILLSNAYTVAQERGGDYITTIDIITAYLLLTEDQTKLLLAKKMKKEDLSHISYWALSTYPQEEHPQKERVLFWGEGIGNEWVSGWTIQTQRYTKELPVYNKEILLTGREKEFSTMLEVLTKAENNNVILIGEDGVGKENLVAAFGEKSFLGNLDNNLNHKKVLELLLNALLAGAQTSGEIEERLQAIIAEVSHAENIILYLPQLQNALGASSGIDISGILLPYLKDGRMPIIATMTPANYKLFMEKNPLREVFTSITVLQPDTKTAVRMILNKAKEIEEESHVIITYPAVTSSVLYASRYMQDDFLPGSAIKLLEDAAYSILRDATRKGKILTGEDIERIIEVRTHGKVGMPTDEEKDILMKLETLLHQRVIGQDEGVIQIAEALRRVRSGLSVQTKPISFLFLGPTGVGKTETARALATIYFGGENKIIRLDMSEYANANSIDRLLGSTPGYGNQRGELTEKVHDNPFSLILLDEFEKAHPDILNLFLQVFDDGRLTDNQGKTVSFVNTIIIATSNAGSEFIREYIAKGGTIDKGFQSALLDMLEQQAIFKPELLNRFDAIIAFKPLTQDQLGAVIALLLEGTKKRLAQQDITATFDRSVIQLIAKEGYDEAFGARPFRRFIQDKIEDALAKEILSGTVQRGAHVQVSAGQDNTLQITNLSQNAKTA